MDGLAVLGIGVAGVAQREDGRCGPAREVEQAGEPRVESEAAWAERG